MTNVMGKMDIAFPNLGIYLSDVPRFISIFGFDIAFYGIIIAMGVFLGFTLASKEGKRLGQPDDIWWDFSVIAIICSVLGARLYYVIFAWDMYKDDFWQIFNIRNGGLAIYGGAIAGFLSLYVFSKVKKQSFFNMADAGVFGLLLGQIIGRWGNFMNQEAYGSIVGEEHFRFLPEFIKNHINFLKGTKEYRGFTKNRRELLELLLSK